VLACVPLDDKDLGNCIKNIMFEEDIIFDMSADDDMRVANDDILIEDEVYIPFGSQFDEYVLQSSESYPSCYLVDDKRCPIKLSACFNHSPRLSYQKSELMHHWICFNPMLLFTR